MPCPAWRWGARASMVAAAALAFCFALPEAASATVVEAPAATGTKKVSLPAIPSVLAADEHCTGASGRQAHAQSWTVAALSLTQTWPLTQGDQVTVAVVDTGVGTQIPALAGRVTAVGGAGTDCVGHGSFAAGLIAAAPTAGVVGAGVAPQVHILAVRGTNKLGATTPDMVASGIRSAVHAGARVVYVGQALASGKGKLTAAVDYATAHDVLVVAPAAPDIAPDSGGFGSVSQPERPYYPAFVPEVVSVMDFGPDGSRPKNAPNVFAADLAAPGDAVVSVGPKGSGHFIGSGSSLAAANVAGAAALVRAYHPQMTAAQVSRQLIDSAYPAATPVVDPYAAVATVLHGTAAPPAHRAAPVRLPPPASAAPRVRALTVAAAGGGLIALVAAGAAVIPLGRARRWRPAGAEEASGRSRVQDQPAARDAGAPAAATADVLGHRG